jgi:microcystin-dependent protein
MGHIKLDKSAGASDIASADGVISVKLVSNDVVVSYSGSTKTTIASTGGNLTQADVQLVVDAIDVMDGASGPAPLVKLSATDLTVTGASL